MVWAGLNGFKAGMDRLRGLLLPRRVPHGAGDARVDPSGQDGCLEGRTRCPAAPREGLGFSRASSTPAELSHCSGSSGKSRARFESGKHKTSREGRGAGAVCPCFGGRADPWRLIHGGKGRGGVSVRGDFRS